jgi:hypothetical protein
MLPQNENGSPPPTQQVVADEKKLPIELSTMASSAKEYIDVLAYTDPEKLRRMLGEMYSVPPKLSDQQIAQNQNEIQALQGDVRFIRDRVLKYGGIGLALLISIDYAIELLKVFL